MKIMRCLVFFCFASTLYTALFAAEQNASINVLDLSETLQAELQWDPLSSSGVLSKNGHFFSFSVASEVALLDYRTITQIDPPFISSQGVFVSTSFASQVDSFFNTKTVPSLYTVGAILIDPGHGGKDPGAVGTHTINGKKITATEKDIALTVSKELYALLKKTYPDKKIILTRSTDIFLTLEERVDIANNIKLSNHEAVLYVSVHANSTFNKKATGFEVWYLTPDYRRTVIKSTDEDKEIFNILNSMMEEEFTTESVLIAKFISDGLQTQIGAQSPNRGLKEEEWFVVRNANMPSVLIEVGFVSNEKEAALLNDTEYLHKIASGIYTGLVAFVTNFEKSRGFTNSP